MKKIRSTLLFICCLLFSLIALGQPGFMNSQKFLSANSRWPLGDSTGLNFNTATPSTFMSALQPETGLINAILGGLMYLPNDPMYGIASVSDTKGNLLFYSNGHRAYNSNHQVMPNGDTLAASDAYTGDLIAGKSTLQSTCIVPFPWDSSKYYVFVLNGREDDSLLWVELQDGAPPRSLTYSIVDRNLNTGLGDIVPGSKNILLDSTSLSGGMIAVPGSNCDIWLLVHEYKNPVFKAYHITEAGIDPNPVISTTGTALQGPAACYMACLLAPLANPLLGMLDAMAAYGTRTTMTLAPNGKLISVANFVPFCMTGVTYGVTGVLLCRFDPGTGIVSDGIVVDENLQTASVAFSPDNSKLYMVHNSVFDSMYAMTTIPLLNPDTNSLSPVSEYQLLQYDISSYVPATITASKTIIDPDVITSEFSTLRLYNNKIYVNNDPAGLTKQRHPTGSAVAIGVINNPDAAGTACNYNPLQIPLPGKYFYTFPNQVVFPSDPDTTGNSYLDTTICSAHLDGGFPPGVTLQASTGFDSCLWDNGSTNAVRSINRAGKYWVLNFAKCHSRVDTYIVRHIDISFELKDTVACYNNEVRISPRVTDPDSYTYLWDDNSTLNHRIVGGAQVVSLTLSKGGCSASDTAAIYVFSYIQELGEDRVYCMDDRISLQFDANVPAPDANVIWNTGATTPSITATDTGTYTVTVSSEYCSATDEILLTREMCECDAAVPNAFSPNGDGLNEVFLPVIESGCLIGGFSLAIYNRMGELIFSSNSVKSGWDGNQKGKPVDIGIYYYELRFDGGTKRKEHNYKGSLTLIR